MQIGEAAKRSGVSAKMIRYYESVGLLPGVARRGNAYRDYSERDVHELRFIGRARALGFQVSEIGALLSLWRDRSRASHEVHEIAAGHLARLDRQIANMMGMAEALRHLVRGCHNDARPDCPILEELSGAAVSAKPARASSRARTTRRPPAAPA